MLVGRTAELEHRIAVFEAEELEKVDEYAAAGADHMIVMLSQPFDISAVEKYLASTR